MSLSKDINNSKKCHLSLCAMGGQFIYTAYPQPSLPPSEVILLFRKVHEEVLRIENKYTEFKESDLERINQSAGISSYPIDEETLYLLEQSKKYYRDSNHIFDITYSTRNKKWRENQHEQLGYIEKLKLKRLVDFKKVQIDIKKMTIYLPLKGMRIGFGGIGKGYAVDRAYELLRKEGLTNFSVNGSGDTRVHSHENAPRPWKIGIRNPFNKDPEVSAGLVQVKNGSVSTSGSYIQKAKGDTSGRNHHIYTSYKNTDESPPVSTTIIGDNCIDTDIWATIAMATDIKSGLKLLEKHSINAILIDLNGKTFLTSKALSNFNR